MFGQPLEPTDDFCTCNSGFCLCFMIPRYHGSCREMGIHPPWRKLPTKNALYLSNSVISLSFSSQISPQLISIFTFKFNRVRLHVSITHLDCRTVPTASYKSLNFLTVLECSCLDGAKIFFSFNHLAPDSYFQTWIQKLRLVCHDSFPSFRMDLSLIAISSLVNILRWLILFASTLR